MIKTKNPHVRGGDFSTRFSGSENNPIVSEPSSPVKNLRAYRARLLSELVALDGLPQEELKKRYMRIHPQLRFVHHALANQTNNLARNRTNLNQPENI